MIHKQGVLITFYKTTIIKERLNSKYRKKIVERLKSH